MNKLIILTCLCCMLVGLASCNSNDPSNEITIYGNVIDRTTGQPLYNVLIQEKNKVGGSTVTGYDGNYEFSLPLNGSSNGTYYLVASKDGYSTSEYELEMSHVDKDRRIKVDFQLKKEAMIYIGTVVDQDNKPIADANISAMYWDYQNNIHSIGTTAISRTDGSYTLELPIPQMYHNSKYYNYSQWSYKITAKKEGYADIYYTMNQNADDIGKTITLNFALKSTRVTIFGKVVDQNGKPIANANICDFIFSTASWDSEDESYYNYKGLKKLSTTQSDINGNYTISSIVYLRVDGYDSRNHEYECYKEGYNTQRRYLNTTDEDGGKSYNIDFTLTKQ